MFRCSRLKNLLTLLLIVLPFGGNVAVVLAASPEIATSQITPNQLMQQGWEHYKARQFQAAIEVWQKAKQLYQAQKDILNQGSALFNISAAYLGTDNYRGAVATIEEFQTISTAQPLQIQGQALNNLGYAYAALGDETNALRSYRAALSIMQTLKDDIWVSKLNLNIGNAYESFGEYDQAHEHFQISLKLAQQNKEQFTESLALSNIGQYYSLIGKYEAAIVNFDKSLQISRAIDAPIAQANTLINLGSAYQALGKLNQAIPLYTESLALSQKIKSRKNEADALQSLGLIYEDQKNYDKAIQFHRQSLEIAKSIQHSRMRAAISNNIGHALFAAGNLDEAQQQVRSALQILDQLRAGLKDSEQVSIFDTQTFSYNLLQQILVAANKPEPALEATEQGRARAFSALLAQRSFNRKQQEKAVEESFTLTTQQIKALAQKQNATFVEYSLVPADEFTFRGKQTAPAEAILIWVIQPTGKVTLRKIDLKKQSIEQLIADSRGALGVNNRGFTPKQPSQPSINTSPKLKQLHKLLIEPIQDLLPTNPDDPVVFVPQADLFQVPFPALQDNAGEYLIKKHTILTAPSLQVLQEISRSQHSEGETLIVGNPTMPRIVSPTEKQPIDLISLPGAGEEAIAIGKLLNAKAFTGDNARKSDILAKLPKARIIHLATHGLLDDFKGLGVPGAIALAPSGTGEPNDGLLTASEILDLKLNAELVVLSACDSGRGKITGDSVIGLSRSFLSAGASSVIVSLWSIPDAPTAGLMTEFYRNFKERKLSKAQSLRSAMLKTMKTHPDPKNWAAFTLIGGAN